MSIVVEKRWLIGIPRNEGSSVKALLAVTANGADVCYTPHYLDGEDDEKELGKKSFHF